ncbi:MAG: ATP-binding protein [Thermodesulfobacteriota bacterium]
MKKTRERDLSYRAIRQRILTAMLIVPFLPFLLALSVGYYHFYGSLKSEAIAKMEALVDGHRTAIETFLDERSNDLRLIINSYDFNFLKQPANLARIFATLREADSGFLDLGVFDAEGEHLAYIGPYQLTGIIYRDQAWFQEVMRKRHYISDVFLGFRRFPHFIIAVARESDGNTWVLRATVDTALFDQTVANVMIGQTGEAYIVNKAGFLQTPRRSGGGLMDKDEEAGLYLVPHKKPRTFVAPGRTGENYLYATAWLKENEWLLVVRQNQADAFKRLRQATALVLLVSVAGGFLILAAALYATYRIVRRLARIDEEKNQLNQQLIRAERLAQVGEMSAGVAHEINNPLQIIEMERTLIEMSLADIVDREEVRNSSELEQIKDSLAQIKTQVGRGAEITQGLMKFARKKEQDAREISLAGLIPEIIGLVKRKAMVEGITIEEDISPRVPPVKVDPAQFQQVILNLMNNAIDAVMKKGQSPNGLIRLTLKQVDGQAEIRISDNGVGISRENVSRIFSPFFTTKPVGQGTGLGLSVCYGIINQLGGTIEVDSEEGRGATFIIKLPILGRV